MATHEINRAYRKAAATEYLEGSDTIDSVAAKYRVGVSTLHAWASAVSKGKPLSRRVVKLTPCTSRRVEAEPAIDDDDYRPVPASIRAPETIDQTPDHVIEKMFIQAANNVLSADQLRDLLDEYTVNIKPQRRAFTEIFKSKIS